MLTVRGIDYGKDTFRYEYHNGFAWESTTREAIDAHLNNGGTVLWNPSNL